MRTVINSTHNKRFKTFLFNFLMFGLISITYANQLSVNTNIKENQKMNNLCDLPENIDAFKQYIKSKYGDEISYDEVNELEKELGSKHEKFYTDWLAKDKSTKIKYVVFGKKCTAKDDVQYSLGIAIVFNKDNKYITHTSYLRYFRKAFLDKKRPPYFSLFDQRTAKKIIERDTIGIMNKTQFDEYIRGTGAVSLQEAIKKLHKGINKFSKLPFTDTTKLTKSKETESKQLLKIYNELKNNKQKREVYFYSIEYDAIVRGASGMIYLNAAHYVMVEYGKNDIVKKITIR